LISAAAPGDSLVPLIKRIGNCTVLSCVRIRRSWRERLLGERYLQEMRRTHYLRPTRSMLLRLWTFWSTFTIPRSCCPIFLDGLNREEFISSRFRMFILGSPESSALFGTVWIYHDIFSTSRPRPSIRLLIELDSTARRCLPRERLTRSIVFDIYFLNSKRSAVSIPCRKRQ
jgi:hypothetical protein